MARDSGYIRSSNRDLYIAMPAIAQRVLIISHRPECDYPAQVQGRTAINHWHQHKPSSRGSLLLVKDGYHRSCISTSSSAAIEVSCILVREVLAPPRPSAISRKCSNMDDKTSNDLSNWARVGRRRLRAWSVHIYRNKSHCALIIIYRILLCSYLQRSSRLR